MDENFKIITNKGEYAASRQGGEDWIVVIKFLHREVQATYIFKNMANTAIAQQIFHIDKHAF